jgi:hypothetical protein
MRHRRSFLGLLASTAVLILSAGVAEAIDLAALGEPQETPILTVSGKITETNAGETAQFDRAMLEKIGMESFKTNTPWFTGEVEFEGVPLAVLMETVGATGTEVEAVALNDYKASIPIEDFAKYNVLLALKRDGEYMPVRDKGPLFIVYPYDEYDELQAQKFYSRSAWQVKELTVR